MSTLFIQGSAGGLPDEIVYIPEGTHEISPTVNGKPGKVTVSLPPERGIEIAARFQRALERRHEDTVRPILDFDHKAAGPAAAIPKGFTYRPGMGLMLEVEWTGAGRSAIEGRDFSYFSPEFHINDDGTPFTLPSRGSIGSLVNNPAFRAIPRIAAADHGGRETVDEEINRRATALIAAGSAADIDEAQDQLFGADPGLYDRYCDSLHDGSRKAATARIKANYGTPEETLEGRARAMVAAGEAPDIDEALDRVVNDDPALYDAYCRSLHIR